jgi:hypothetical protein
MAIARRRNFLSWELRLRRPFGRHETAAADGDLAAARKATRLDS